MIGNKLTKMITTAMLLVSIITFVVIIIMYIMGKYTFALLIEDTFFVLLTIISVLLLPKLEKYFKLELSVSLSIQIYVFLFALLIVGNVYDVLLRVLWYDKILHFASGIFVTSIGILFAKKWIPNGNIKILGYIGFLYSATTTLLWEIIEFVGDILMSVVYPSYTLRMQGFHISQSIWILPQPYGLADTMIDVTLGVLGAFLCMLYYRHLKESI